MVLFGRKSLVCYLTSGTLAVLQVNNNKENLTLSSYIVYGEVVDEKKYKEELQKFLEGLKLKEGKGILVLSSELVFFKEIKAPYKSGNDEVENFLTKVPLTRSSIAAISPHNTSKLQILAVNRKLYEAVVEVFANNGIKIFSVIPASVLANRKNSLEFTSVDAKNILREKKIIEKYNFLQSKQNSEIGKAVEPVDLHTQGEEKKNMQKQYILLLLSLLLLVSAVGYFLLWSEIMPNPWFKKPIVSKEPITTNITSVTSQPLPTEKLLMGKASVKIQILNGSGVEGQAGEVSLLLQDAGYKNIVAGNAESSEQTTKITHKNQVPKEILDKIIEEVRKIFRDVNVSEASQSAEFDIVITTGSR